MLTMGSTNICSVFVQPKLAGDFALIKGLAKRVIELDDEAVALGAERILDAVHRHPHHRLRRLRRRPARRKRGPVIAESGVARGN
jgi:hypothetical protein